MTVSYYSNTYSDTYEGFVVPHLYVTMQAHENLLSANVASVETDLTGIVADTNCTIARTTAQAAEGVASLEMTASAAGTMAARTQAVEGGYPKVVAGYTYTVRAAFRAATTAGRNRVEVRWLDANNGVLSTIASNYVTSGTLGWTVVSVEGVAPAGAVRALILWRVGDGTTDPAAGEVHYVDAMSVRPGAGQTGWSPGGRAATVEFFVDYSDDIGATWTRHPRMGGVVDPVGQGRGDRDYEVASGQSRRYRISYTVEHEGSTLVSPYTYTADGSYTLTDWWLKDVFDIDNSFIVYPLPPLDITYEEPQTEFAPLGREFVVVVAGNLLGERATLNLELTTDTAWKAVKRARDTQRVLLLQDPFGGQRYVRLGQDLSVALVYSDASVRRRQVKVGYVEQPVPA